MNTFLISALGVGVLVLLWLFFWRRSHHSRDRALTALVFLMKHPHVLTEPQLRQAIAAAWGMELGSEMQEGGDWLVQADRVNPAMAQPNAKNFLISCRGRMFLINTVSRPYMDNPEEEAEGYADLRLRQAVGSHRAWNSVDLFGEPPSAEDRPEVYAALGRLLAEFANEDCLAVYCPELGRCNEYAPTVVETLRSGKPLEMFEEPTHAPIIQVSGEDPRMIAAVEEARRRWPEFVTAFNSRTSNESPFAAKACFADGEDEEFMWISIQTIAGDVITGRLENTPAFVKTVKEGDLVTVRFADLNDWFCEINGEGVGGFTLKVMSEVEGKQA
jgi:uncharacterized protein YegJ (DUF2314 family)